MHALLAVPPLDVVLVVVVVVVGEVGEVGVPPPQPRIWSMPAPTPNLAARRSRPRRSMTAPVAARSR